MSALSLRKPWGVGATKEPLAELGVCVAWWENWHLFFTFHLMKQVVSRAFTANDLVRIQNTFVSCTSCIVTDGGFVVFDRHQVHWFITPSFPALLISLETFSLMKNPRGSHLSRAGGVVGRDIKGHIQRPPGTGSRQQNNVAQNAWAAALGLCSREAEQPPSAWSHERPPPPFWQPGIGRDCQGHMLIFQSFGQVHLTRHKISELVFTELKSLSNHKRASSKFFPSFWYFYSVSKEGRRNILCVYFPPFYLLFNNPHQTVINS